MRSSARAALVAVTVALAALAAPLAAEEWIHLGTRRVTDRVDHDRIEVGAGRGTFSALQLRVGRAAIQFRSVVVHFSNGKRQEIELRAVIPADGQSRVIDLVGDDRRIRAIELFYDAQTRGRAGGVRVFGRR
jgi:hypothetical protein